MNIVQYLTNPVTDSNGVAHFFALIDRKYHTRQTTTWCMVVDGQVIPHLTIESGRNFEYLTALYDYLCSRNLELIDN